MMASNKKNIFVNDNCKQQMLTELLLFKRMWLANSFFNKVTIFPSNGFQFE